MFSYSASSQLQPTKMQTQLDVYLEWSLFRGILIHEKKHKFQNPWLLSGDGCYSEGCYWEEALYHEKSSTVFSVTKSIL